MFKQLVVTSFVLANISCTSILSKTIKDTPTVNQQAPEITNANCPGNVDLPPELAGKLTPVNDTALLNSSIGKPNKGKLCQGAVYQVKENTHINIFRAWNSTNPGSEMGSWWAHKKAEGPIADYRKDYEICFQWSPLDQLTHCQLKAGTKVVIGTGQSATCSPYLHYPTSTQKQIFIQNTADVVSNCRVYVAKFDWQISE